MMGDTDSLEADLEQPDAVPEKFVQGILVVQYLTLSDFDDESCSLYNNVLIQTTIGKYCKRTKPFPFHIHKEVTSATIAYNNILFGNKLF